MVESFDEFARKREEQQRDRERLAKDTAPEWSMLESFSQSLATDGKGVDGYKFEWVADDHSPMLVMGAVAATFLHHKKNGQLTDFRVRFDRRPPGLNRVWVDDKSPLEPVEWFLEPKVVDDCIRWTITNVGWPRPDFSSKELSEKIGIKLTEFHDAYKKHYENWGSTVTCPPEISPVLM